MTPLSIQIMRWLRQVTICRFVGLVSSIVGLVCYALSSSFNYLFGEWNLFKIILYSTFGFFICLWSLFAKVCQRSTSFRFKAHSAFLVLTITSVYSYFTDKSVNGKPDSYSLISCAAFAIMSLSLSRQTECGFEVDLFYFFLGCLIVLLMKINLALTIVGLGFSYGLIILRSSLDTTSYQNLTPQEDHSVVIDINSLCNTDNACTIQEVMACKKALQQYNSNLTNMILEHVKEYLEDNSELPVLDLNFVIDVLPSGKINNLHKTIKLMVDNGFEKECCNVFCNWRSELLEECLLNLFGLQEIINMEQKLEGKELQEYIIRRWIKVLKVVLSILFPSERRLCDRIFSGLSSAADICFTEVCRGVTIQLMNFADAVASGSPSLWRMRKIIDMFETLCYVIPEFQSLFAESLVKEVKIVLDKLGEASRNIFVKMENMIFCIPQVMVIASADGRVHPMTKYVMGYLGFAHQAQQSLEQILEQYPAFINGAVTCSVSDQIDRIMKRFEGKLLAMSKNYNNPALGHFFLMKNGH